MNYMCLLDLSSGKQRSESDPDLHQQIQVSHLVMVSRRQNINS